MAKKTMLKLPKAPKSSASVEVKEAYLKRLAEIKKENARRAAENKKSEDLTKRIAKARADFRK